MTITENYKQMIQKDLNELNKLVNTLEDKMKIIKEDVKEMIDAVNIVITPKEKKK